MKALTVIHRKLLDIEELREANNSKPKWMNITNVISLPKSEFNYFSLNLMDYYDWLEGEDTVIVKHENGELTEGIVVVTEGYTYVKYAGLVLATKEPEHP
jgi:hypothetical protein